MNANSLENDVWFDENEERSEDDEEIEEHEKIEARVRRLLICCTLYKEFAYICRPLHCRGVTRNSSLEYISFRKSHRMAIALNNGTNCITKLNTVTYCVQTVQNVLL